MGKKLLLFLACMFMTASMAFAQKQITGTVVDAESGEPLIGVAVRVPDTTTGVLTDVNGKFSIVLPANKKNLNFNFMGMKPASLEARNGMIVHMETDTKAMDEVMVVAYGTQTKSSFTGSAAIVGSEEIGKMQVTNAVDAIKGKAAGVQIYTASGQPGETPTIRVRGFNSMIAGQSPLLVLDGSPYDGSLNDINPADVESMTVLKDAASTALYGARGGNGVIIITTKQGKRNKDAEINFEAKWGSSMKGSRDYNMISDPRGYYETYYQGLNNYAKNQLGKSTQDAWQWANANLVDRAPSDGAFGLGYQVYDTKGVPFIGMNGKVNPAATLGNVVTGIDGNQYLLTPDNWSDEIFHKGMRQQYTVNASGASDKGTYYASVDYLDQDGITYGSSYDRLTARLKADYMLKSWLKLGVNGSYGHYNRSYMNEEGSSSSGNIFALRNIAPIYPVFMRDQNGNILTHQASGILGYDYSDATVGPGITRPYLSQANPISDLLVDTRNYKGDTFNGTATFDVYLPKNITFTSINNIYFSNRDYTSVTNPYFGQYKNSNGIVTREDDRVLNTNFQQRLNWSEKFGQHSIEAMAAHEFYKRTSNDLWGNKHNMFSQKNKELDGAVVVDDTGSSFSTYNTESWMLRAMYDYAQRYYVQGSFMRQASSAFHPDHRWGSFWSASAGWMMSKESWLEDQKWLDELKLKASFGQNGNDFNLNGFYYTNRYDIVNSNGNVSLNPSTLGKNENLSWETSTKFNVGVDFSMFKDRLFGTVEFYNNQTSGLITSVPYAPSYGYTSFYDNVGNMRNRGIELDLHGVVARTKDLEVSLYANVTSNQNRITELHDARKTQTAYILNDDHTVTAYRGYSSGSYFYTEGQSRYTYHTKRYAGVYNEETYASTGDAAYDPSKAGKALYYKNIYAKDADGEFVTDADKNKVVEEVVTTDNYSEADFYMIGDVLPKVFGGFGANVSYKGFDLSVDFTYQLGGKVYDSEYQTLMAFDAGYGFHTDLLNAWSVTNKGSNIPRLNAGDSYAASSSDRFLTSAKCLTLNNISFGYSLPKSLLSKAHLTKVRVFAVGDNLFTWSARKGLDPRMSPTGDNSGLYYSPIRTISGGVQIGF